MFWLGAIVSLCYVPGVTGAYIATQWPVLGVLLCFALWHRVQFTWAHAAWVAFVAYAVAITPTSAAPGVAVWGIWLIVIMGLCLWFGSVVENTRGLYAGLAFGGGVSSLAATAQYFGLLYIPGTSLAAAGLYVNSVQHATVLALIAVALVTERMWLWLLPLVPGFVIAGSRGAAVALVVGLIGCRVRTPWLLVATLLVGASFLTAFPLGPSDQMRSLIWRSALDNLTWFGWGPGVFYSIALPYNGTMIYPEHAHNDALQLVFEYGIGAVLPLSVFVWALLRTQAKEWPVILAFAVASCYSMPLWMPVASFLVFVTVGRVLRGDAVVERIGSYGRLGIVPRRYEAGGEAVSVASHH